MNVDRKTAVDLIRYPLLTEKTIKLIDSNQYSFAVHPHATKPLIKSAVEQLFDVKVISVNTSYQAIKKRRVGKFIGKLSRYKRAIVTLASEDSITLFKNG